LDKRNDFPVEGKTFEEVLVFGTKEELNELKNWLFEENIRVEANRNVLHEMEHKFIDERKQFQDEMKQLNNKLVQERRRFKEDTSFFDKKMEILQSGFSQLDMDKRKLEKERKHFYAEREAYEQESYHSQNDAIESLFRGANTLIALKKRYKDLLKIFHPDNLGGDHEMVLAITQFYEDVQSAYHYGKQA
jgi:hypothetical protein